MLYTIGSRVKLRQTGDIGTVSRILGDELVEIRLDGGLGHIPVPTDSLTYENDLPPTSEKTDGARYVEGKQKSQESATPTDLGLSYTILKPWGIQIAFDPVMMADGETPDRYRIYIINDFLDAVIFQVELDIAGSESWSRVGQLAGHQFAEVGELKHHELNDQPSINLEVRKQLKYGTGPRLYKKLKLKPKQFFKQRLTAPLLNRKVYHYTVFPELVATEKSKSGVQQLSEITKREAGRKPNAPQLLRYQTTPNPRDIAAFPREIDLHIEALTNSPGSIVKGKHLGFQLDHCRAYLRRANELGVDRVYIIHGLGEGKLRSAVHEMLGQMPFVKSFKNEWHQSYGNGATEVSL